MNAEPQSRPSPDLPGWTTVTDAEGRPVAIVRTEGLAGDVLRMLREPKGELGDARVCEGCGGQSRVTDSRAHGSGAIRRRRRCDVCKVSWTTFETRARPYSDDA